VDLGQSQYDHPKVWHGGSASAHTAMLSDVPSDDADVLPTFEDCKDENYDTEVSVPSAPLRYHLPSPLVVTSRSFG
jgi:hypothetical protein